MSVDPSIAEETVELSHHFLPPERLVQVEAVLGALAEDPHLEFLLAVLDVTINDSRLPPNLPPTRFVLHKLLQALDEADGEMLLYESPYNQLAGRDPEEIRVEPWNFDLAPVLLEFKRLQSVRAFLEHGTGKGHGRGPQDAQGLHDTLLAALVGDSTNFAVYGCANVRTMSAEEREHVSPEEGLWPAESVSSWYHGVFWDDLLFVLNPPESTLSILALTSH